MRFKNTTVLKVAIVSLGMMFGFQANAQTTPPWGLDGAQGTLLRPGISPVTFAAQKNPKDPADGQYTLTLFDARETAKTNGRTVNTLSIFRHPDWTHESANNIGQVYGLAIDDERYIYTTASTHFSPEVGVYYSIAGFLGSEAINAFGTIGGGADDLAAAGTVYKLDRVTGAASIFAQLPQQADDIKHVTCEGLDAVAGSRTTGPALGNIAYDPIHNQFFVSNFEDGKIYRLDKAGAVLSIHDPWVADDGSAGLAPDRKPYGLAVNPDGSKLFFGTLEAVLDVEGAANSLANSPGIYSIDLTAVGDFSGVESARLIQLTADDNNIDIGGILYFPAGGSLILAKDPGWVAVSDLEFTPDGKLVAGLRTGCAGTLYSSHIHGGTAYTLTSDGTAIDKELNMHYSQDYGPDDGYGGVAIYDLCEVEGGVDKYEYFLTSGDIKEESGPHGVMTFPHDFTNSADAVDRIEPVGSFGFFPSVSTSSATNADGDFKGVGGDVEVLDMEKDFADAPDSYHTLQANNGPSHRLTGNGLLIGVTVDDEKDGQDSGDALGDDGNINGKSGDVDDEDGFNGPITLTVGGSSVLTIPVKNPPSADIFATLYGWVDLNGDDDFDDAGEFQAVAVPPGFIGNKTLNFGTIPEFNGTSTFARFRITSDTLTASDFGGPATDGEVEDHPVVIINPMSIGSVLFLDNNVDGINGAGDTPISGATVRLLVEDPAVPGSFIDAVDLNNNNVGAQTTGSDGQYYFDNLPEGNYKVTVEPPAVGGYLPTLNQITTDDNGAVENDSNIKGETTPGSGVFESPVIELKIGDEKVEINGGAGDDQDDGPVAIDNNGDMTVDFGFFQLKDYGDQPDSYGTTLANNGPSHVIRPGLGLGSLLDAELDGVADTNAVPTATGDDLDGLDDEDAIDTSVLSIPVADANGDATTDYTLSGVAVKNTTTVDGKVYGYIDFNGDGDFDDAGETSAGVDVPGDGSVTSVDLVFSGIGAINVGNTGVRLRLSTDDAAAGLPTGPAPDGEIEDHRIEILPVVRTVKVLASTFNDNFDLTSGTETAPASVNGGQTAYASFEAGATTAPDQIVINELSNATAETYVATMVCLDENGGLVHTEPASLLTPGGTYGITSDALTMLGSSKAQNTVTCTITNTQATKVVLVKSATPQDDTDFEFTGVLTDNINNPTDYAQAVTLDGEIVDNDGDTFNNTEFFILDGFLAGHEQQYDITETQKPGWYLSSIQCSDAAVSGSTPVITNATPAEIASGTIGIDIQFGDTITCTWNNIELVSVGSLLWVDANNNGIQDAGEAPIEGATVTLLNADGTPAMAAGSTTPLTTTTTASGEYHFNDLLPGDYIVEVDLAGANTPTGVSDLTSVVPSAVQNTNVNDDLDTDSNIDINSTLDTSSTDQKYYSSVVSLSPGNEPENEAPTIMATDSGQPNQSSLDDKNGNMTVDFGFIQPVSIGSYVWEDLDANGLQDAGEPVVAGTATILNSDGSAVVDLAGNTLTAVPLSATGEYFFDNLAPGDYKIQITPTDSSYIPTPTQVNLDNKIENDSNINTGATVPAGTFESPVINLTPGDELTETGAEVGDAQDNAAIATDDAGDMTVDFGFIRPVSIGSFVWEDIDGNGLQDPGEPVVAGTATIVKPDGSPVIDLAGNTLTSVPLSAAGEYFFDNLIPGDYKIQITPTDSSYMPTPTQVNLDDNVENDSNINIGATVPAGTYESPVINLTPGAEPTEGAQVGDHQDDAAIATNDSGDMTVDFGFIRPVSIGSFVWEDSNGNGLQDIGEPAIAGTATIVKGDGSPVIDFAGNTLTAVPLSAAGEYFFDNLPQGDYKIQITPTDTDYIPTPTQANLDNNIENDSNINVGATVPAGTFESPVINLMPGEEPTEGAEIGDDQDDAAIATNDSGDMTVDFGFIRPVSIGSFVWEDTNDNGLQDLNEPGIENAQLYLIDSNGSVVTTDIFGNDVGDDATGVITTGPNGQYIFDDLPPGDYQIKVIPPADKGYSASAIQQTNDDDDTANDSNIALEPAPGEYLSGVFTLEVGNEPDASSTSAESVPDSGDDLDDALTKSRDIDGNMTVDFGFVQKVSIGSFIWDDLNNDGIQDPGEPGIAGVMVELFDEAGNPVATSTTDNTGLYYFDDLNEGKYRVEVTPPSDMGYRPTANQVSDADTDSASSMNDTNIASASGGPVTFTQPGTHSSGLVELLFGSEVSGSSEDEAGDDQDDAADIAGNMTVDFGFYRPKDLGDQPDTYGTTLANNGPSHIIREGLGLGASVDDELDGVADTNAVPTATGDDLAGLDDEDAIDTSGLSIPVADVNGNATTDYTLLGVAVKNTTTVDGKVYGYIDFNGDGDFNDAGETSAGVDVPGDGSVTSVDLVFSGIGAINVGNTGVRLRLSTDDAAAGLPTGPAPDGEIEDHRIEILPVVKALKILIPEASTDTFDLTSGAQVANGVGHAGETPFQSFDAGASPGMTISELSDSANALNYVSQAICRDELGGVVYSGVVKTIAPGDTNSLTSSDLNLAGNSKAENTVICTFTNTSETKIAVLKSATPADTTDFSYTTTWSGPNNPLHSSFQLDGELVDSEPDASTVSPFHAGNNQVSGTTSDAGSQTLTITEEAKPGWVVAGASCAVADFDDLNGGHTVTTDLASGVSFPVSGPVTITVENIHPGDTVTCTFDNIELVSVGSLLWVDANNNGVQDDDEAPIVGATVKLLNADGSDAVAADGTKPLTTTSTVSGEYNFNDLLPGDYIVQVDLSGATTPTGVTDLSTLVPTEMQNTNVNDDNDTDSNIDVGSALDTIPTDQIYYSAVVSLSPSTEPVNESTTINAGDSGQPNQGVLDDNNGNMTVDFGFIQPVSIGSYVWTDSNGDGLQGSTADELPIAGANILLLKADGTPAIDLTGTPVAAFVTGADGKYVFDNLPEGKYVVQVTPPAGYVDTVPQSPNDDGTANDSNILSETAGVYVSPVIALKIGSEPEDSDEAGEGFDQDGTGTGTADDSGDMTIDFGFIRPLSIGSYIWEDTNNDGKQEATESGVDQASVELFVKDASGAFVAAVQTDGTTAVPSQTTGPDGLYNFTDLPPGDYKVVVTPEAGKGFIPSTPQVTTDNDDSEDDSNIALEPTPGSYESGVFTLEVGKEPNDAAFEAGDDQDDANETDGNMTVDFGFIRPLSIGSVVWNDANQDGLQGSVESGIPGATIRLVVDNGFGVFVTAKDIDGQSIASKVTDANGNYLFDNLPAGDYKVQVTPPAGYLPGPKQDEGSNDSVDSDIASETAQNSGIFESGVYTLSPGVLAEGANEASPLPNNGDDQDNPNAGVDANGDMTVDFAFVETVSIGSTVFLDNNGDAQHGVDEPGIRGIEVQLYKADASGNIDTSVPPLNSVVTDLAGNYYFGNLLPGDYVVVIPEPPVNAQKSSTGESGVDDGDAGGNDGADVGIQSIIGAPVLSPVISLSVGDEPTIENEPGAGGLADDALDSSGDMTVDFGFVSPASIGNYVWLDFDGDGVQDANEDGIPGVVVNLLVDTIGDGAPDTISTSTVTGPNGEYLFPDLEPGTPYQVVVDDSTLPPSLVQTYDEGSVVGSLGVLDHGSETIVLQPNEEHLTADFGYAPPPGSIGNAVWVDANGNGQQDPGEPGIPNVTIELFDGDGNVIDTVVTDEQGKYLFTGKPEGVYGVGVDMTTIPPQYSAHDLGDPDVRDGLTSKADNLTTVTLETINGIVSTNLDADFGYLPEDGANNEIGDTIWLDIDKDGNGPAGPNGTGVGDNSDTTETTFEGVTVTLFNDVNGDGVLDDDDEVIGTTITDENGQYLFTGLPDGKYLVKVTDANNVLSDVELVSDPDSPAALDGVSAVDLDSTSIDINKVSNLDQDFGYAPPLNTDVGVNTGVIGDSVLFDQGGGIEGVTVELYDGSGNLIDVAVTDENGHYLFTGLEVSTSGVDYEVKIKTDTLPGGGGTWLNTVDPDSPSVPDNVSQVKLTAAAPVDLSQDFSYGGGINKLSGTIWQDDNEDGVQDETKTFAGVTVVLLDPITGNIISNAVTDAQGNYEFTNLPDGRYVIRVTDDANVLAGFEHTDGNPAARVDKNSKDDTGSLASGYIVDLDALGNNAGAVEDKTSDFGYKPSLTTPITLGSFSSAAIGVNEVQFSWTTHSEMANVGFLIYQKSEGAWLLVTDSLVAAKGESVKIEHYSITMQNVEGSEFTLVDVDSYGQQTVHGPFRLGETFGAPDKQSSPSVNWRAIKAAPSERAFKKRSEHKRSFKSALDVYLGK